MLSRARLRAVPARCLAAAWQPRPGGCSCLLDLLGPLGFVHLCFRERQGKDAICVLHLAARQLCGGVYPGGNRKEKLQRCSWYPTRSHLLHFKYFMATAFSLCPGPVAFQDFHQHSSTVSVQLCSSWHSPVSSPAPELQLSLAWREPGVLQLWAPFLCQTDFKRAVQGEFEGSHGYQRVDLQHSS